jgi:ABC-2 type transporter
LDEELDALLEDGRKRHAVDTEQHSEFSTSWLYQVKTLWEREIIRHWRDPTYMLAKLALNIVAGLFIGFTFFKAKDSIQGTQNKIFVSRYQWCPAGFLVVNVFVRTGCLYEYGRQRTLIEPDSGPVHHDPTRV